MLNLTDHCTASLEDFDSIEGAVFFCGESIDDRGREIIKKIKHKTSNCVIKVHFDISKYTINLNGKDWPVLKANSAIDDIVKGHHGSSYYLDSTTIDFVELLLVLRWLSRSNEPQIHVFYAEPLNYKSRIDYMSDFGKHEFDLSSHSSGFKAVPGFSRAISTDDKATLIAVLGFERSRLGQLIQLDEGAYIGDILPIYGTPGFKVGWDKHSFFQNVMTLKDRCSKPHFVSAHSAIDIFKKLQMVKSSLPDVPIMIAPFATKPLSLGVAVFLVNHSQDVTLKYDHPLKKINRSEGIGKIHRYTVTVDE